jgi:A118 family predicted phage portal protein
MNMAKKGCEDWTTLLFNEKVQITVNDEAINDEVHKVLDDNNFDVEFSNLLEKSFAVGTGVMIEFINNDKIMIDYIAGDMLIVTAYRNNDITGICTVNEIQDKKDIITHLTYHDIRDVIVNDKTISVYTIEHEVFVSPNASQLGKSAPLTRVFSEQEAQQLAVIVDGETKFIVTYETDTAHFQIVKPNVVNNYDMDNPMGISIFANRIDNLKAMDLKYDSFTNEFELAKHRIMVDANQVTKEITKATSTGTQVIRPFDTNDSVFLGMNLKNSDKAIEFYNAPIRSDDHFTGLNFEMQTYGFGLGFGQDYYAYDARGVYQNIDAVYSELSDLYSNKKKHEIILVQVWTNLVKSILFLLKETGVIAGEIEQLEIDIKPDDSIIINDEAEYQKDLDRVDRGTFPAWKVEVKWFGLTEQEAKENIAEANTFEEVDNPMPIPNEGEDEETFIVRFMSDEEMMLEFPDESQRRAIAQETFEKSGS